MVKHVLLLVLAAVSLHARQIDVRPGQLREALLRVAPNDSIVLHAGIYQDRELAITKPITIIGRKGAVVDAGHTGGDVFTVRSDWVVIDGIHIKNVKVSYVQDNAAVKILKSKHVTVKNCTITNAFFAIYLQRSERCRIEGNTIAGTLRSESNSGNGIHSWYGREILIKGNTIASHRDGVYLEFSKQITVEENTCRRNMRYGLHFMFSDSCSYRRNTFTQSGAGVAVMYSSFVEMTDNEFRDNWGASTYGLLLKDIRDAHIRGNRFAHNAIGVYAEAASRILFERNQFEANGYAMKMLANSENNTVVNNTFIDNSFEVTTNSKDSYNHFDRNYWGSYEGYDLDRDGFGDVPHHPVRLYSLLVEQMPSSVILMNSVFVNILDLTERVVPTLTPEALVDLHPRIKPLTQ